jgi:ATP-dependent protease HslVU (ClpYQ) peptidase subunit
MSCIVGLKHNGNIYIGGDGRATSNEGEIRPIICNKVFFNNDYLIGFCGSVRSGQLLYPHNFTPPKEILDWPKEMRDHYNDNGALLRDEETGDIHGANVLIAKKGKLFEILVDFQMSEIVEFTAIGSGSPFAFGALEILKFVKGIKPENKVLKALQVSSKYCSQVGPPYEVKVSYV